MDHRDIGLRPTLEVAVLQPITLEHLAPTELNAKFDNFPSCKLPGAAIGKGTLGGPTYWRRFPPLFTRSAGFGAMSALVWSACAGWAAKDRNVNLVHKSVTYEPAHKRLLKPTRTGKKSAIFSTYWTCFKTERGLVAASKTEWSLNQIAAFCNADTFHVKHPTGSGIVSHQLLNWLLRGTSLSTRTRLSILGGQKSQCILSKRKQVLWTIVCACDRTKDAHHKLFNWWHSQIQI
jgi:hypothetical protein